MTEVEQAILFDEVSSALDAESERSDRNSALKTFLKIVVLRICCESWSIKSGVGLDNCVINEVA